MTFLGLVGDCSGLMFFLVLFIMVWETLKLGFRRYFWPLLKWIKNKFLTSFRNIENRISKKNGSKALPT
jgi:hypothetical protein